MSASLSRSARRVQQVLDRHGLDLQVVELPASTRTAAEAARAVGCQVGQIAKSLVFRGLETGRPYLVVASGANRVPEDRLAATVGEPVALADPDFVRETTGFAIGGVPPVGHAQPLPTFLDRALAGYDEIWAAAGTPRAVFRLTPQDLHRLTGSEWIDLS